jgi:hypothetical protein
VEGSRKNSAKSVLGQDDPERSVGKSEGWKGAPPSATLGKGLTGAGFLKSVRKILILNELEEKILKTIEFARFSRLLLFTASAIVMIR